MEMVLDVVALLDRINKLEQQTKELRGIVSATKEEAGKEIERTQEMIWEQQPKLNTEGKLVFETADAQGNTVYGHVVAEIVNDQPDA